MFFLGHKMSYEIFDTKDEKKVEKLEERMKFLKRLDDAKNPEEIDLENTLWFYLTSDAIYELNDPKLAE